MRKRTRESAAGQLPLSRGQRICSQIRHTFENWFLKVFFPGQLIRKKYAFFQRLRRGDRSALEIISRLEEIKQKNLVCDLEYIKHTCQTLDHEVQGLINAITAFNPIKYSLLQNYHRKYAFYVNLALMEDRPEPGPPYILPLAAELSEDLAGGKASTLAALITEHNLPVPPGLVITTRAFYQVLSSNDLLSFIQKQLSRLSPENLDDLPAVSRAIRKAILEADPPQDLETEFKNSLHRLGIESAPLALRSSAVGEDIQASFAGQFESRLNVSPDHWFSAYKEVLAGKYSAHAIYYRMSQGFTDRMTPMAVLVMPTIQARVSGILYTLDQNEPDQAVLYMVSGSGERLAAGAAYQEQARFDIKRQRLHPEDEGSLLPSETLRNLFLIGQNLAEIFGTPQDVEWLVDDTDCIFIVQSRPLRMSAAEPAPRSDYPEDSILARGQWVSSGQASGRIYHLKESGMLSEIPEKTILVTRELPPELTLVLSKVHGIIAEHGSPACHFASVAREAGIPVLCNVSRTSEFENGQIVSLDTDQGLILDGRFFGAPHVKPETAVPETPLRRKISDALAYISPLSLHNPDAREFSAEACKSLHDIVRYVHEAGVREMFSLVGRRGIDRYGAKRLISGLPLVMHVLDVAHGLKPEAKSGKTVHLRDINSRPMQQLFEGLASPVVKWDSAVLHYDWMAYAKSTADFINVEKSTQFSSYAIVDSEYLHALLRFGYHFAVLDAIQSPDAEQNYIHFNFKGGGGNDEQRLFRVQLIQTILAHFRFSVHTAADLLEAAFDRRSAEETGANLGRLGIVLGKTVLLDMRLKNQEHVKSMSESIIQEIYDFFPVQENP